MIVRYVSIAFALCALAMVPRVESQESSKHTVLAFTYYGSLDHPIFPIVISDSYGDAERYRDAMKEKETWDFWGDAYLHVLSQALMGRIIATVESDKGGVQGQPKPPHLYNSVTITIVTAQGRKTLFFHVESAMSLLDQLENLCKDDKSLHSDLLRFQILVRPWGGPSPPSPVRPYPLF